MVALAVGRTVMVARSSNSGALACLPRQARWDLWGQMERVKLRDAVLLSLDLDPEPIPERSPDPTVADIATAAAALERAATELAWNERKPGEPPGPVPPSNAHRINERLKVAEGCLGESLKRVGEAVTPRWNTEVRITDFGRWASAKGWQLPSAFPLSAQPKITGIGLDQRERTSLLQIIGALASMANVDLRKPFVAAQNIHNAAVDKLMTNIAVNTILGHLKKVEDAVLRKNNDPPVDE